MIESFKSAGRFAAFSLGIKLFNYIYLDALSSETIPQSITELAFSMFTDIGPLASNMLVLFSMVHVIFGVVKYIHLKR